MAPHSLNVSFLGADMSKRIISHQRSELMIPVINLAVLGPIGVGKSALVVKYLTGKFINEYDPSLEDVYTRTEYIDNQEVALKIQDTFDEDGSKLEQYLKWADGLVLVYSVTSRNSLQIVQLYLDTIVKAGRNGQESQSDVPILLVGNKTDLERYRQVSKSEGQELAEKYDCLFLETAAAEDYSFVQAVFVEIARIVRLEKERELPLQPLYISEDQGSPRTLGASSSTSAISSTPPSTLTKLNSSRRNKSPKPPIDNKDKKGSSKFQFFNRGFKFSIK